MLLSASNVAPWQGPRTRAQEHVIVVTKVANLEISTSLFHTLLGP